MQKWSPDDLADHHEPSVVFSPVRIRCWPAYRQNLVFPTHKAPPAPTLQSETLPTPSNPSFHEGLCLVTQDQRTNHRRNQSLRMTLAGGEPLHLFHRQHDPSKELWKRKQVHYCVDGQIHAANVFLLLVEEWWLVFEK